MSTITTTDIRKIYEQSLQELAIAELTYIEVIQSSDQRQDENRQNVLHKDDQLEDFISLNLAQTNSIVQRANTIAQKYELKTYQFQPPTNTENLPEETVINELEAAIVNHQSLLQELIACSELIEKEKKKWWKFW